MSDELRYLLLWLCVVAFTAVVAALCTTVVHYRWHGKPLFHHSLAAELAWTLAPLAIVMGLSFPAISAMLLAR